MLTELENCILGVIWREGPISAYGVRSHFAGSPTVSWSSSTGTIYPAIQRLVAAGLVEAGASTGPRKARLLNVTSAGLAALHEWLRNMRPDLGSSTADPLRTRVHFLAALQPGERMRAFEKYRAVSRAKAEELERAVAQSTESSVDPSERIGILGALMEVKARLAWLEMVEADVAKLGSNG